MSTKAALLSIPLFILFISCETGFAQIQAGPKLGIQAARSHYDPIIAHKDSVNSGFVPGFQAGLALNYIITPKFALHGSLAYSMKGKNIRGKFDEELMHKAKYHFIEAPVLFRITFFRPKYQYYFVAGPNISYWLGGKGRFVNTQNIMNGSEEFIYKVGFNESDAGEGKLFIQSPNRLQFGLDMGAGVFLPIARGQKVMVELKYGYGHTNMGLANSSALGSRHYSDNMEASSHVISLSGAYLFEFNLKGWRKGKSTIKK